MVSMLITWVLYTVGFIIAAKLVPGVRVKNFKSAILIAAVYGILSVVIGWLLWSVLTIGTLGLAYVLKFVTQFIVAAIVIKLVDLLMDSLTINGFMRAIIVALVIAGVTVGGEWLLTQAGLVSWT